MPNGDPPCPPFCEGGLRDDADKLDKAADAAQSQAIEFRRIAASQRAMANKLRDMKEAHKPKD
jgi:hypothetical protein